MTASMATQGMNVAPLEQLGSEGGKDISYHHTATVITVWPSLINKKASDQKETPKWCPTTTTTSAKPTNGIPHRFEWPSDAHSSTPVLPSRE